MRERPWIDITIPISEAMVTWPGDIPVQITRSSSIGEGSSQANVTKLAMSAHTGTHVDAPLHFIPDGADITQIDLINLIGPTKVLHITDPHQITFSELKEFSIEAGDRLLFRTRNSDVDWQTLPFLEDYVYLSTNAALYLLKLGVKCIGVDYLSVAGEENGGQVHQLLLGEGIAIIEGLNLMSVVPGNYEMIALPMKIEGSDGAPARVLIRRAPEDIAREEPN